MTLSRLPWRAGAAAACTCRCDCRSVDRSADSNPLIRVLTVIRMLTASLAIRLRDRPCLRRFGQGEHLAVKDWGVSAAQSDPYLRFRQLLRGARPLGYVETLADRELAEGEWWSQPLFLDSRPSRWEGDGGAITE